MTTSITMIIIETMITTTVMGISMIQVATTIVIMSMKYYLVTIIANRMGIIIAKGGTRIYLLGQMDLQLPGVVCSC